MRSMFRTVNRSFIGIYFFLIFREIYENIVLKAIIWTGIFCILSLKLFSKQKFKIY